MVGYLTKATPRGRPCVNKREVNLMDATRWRDSSTRGFRFW